MATTSMQLAPPVAQPETTGVQSLTMHKDRISADALDLKDPYVASSLGLYAIHNVLRRSIASCAQHVKNISSSNTIPFICYSSYTLHVLKDQLESVDTMWFPKFSEYDERFKAQMKAHEAIQKMVDELEELLEPAKLVERASLISEKFEALHKRVDLEFDTEEQFSNELGHRIPIDEIRVMEKKQEERRSAQVKIYGHLWSAVYLLRALAPKERAIFPPGIPKVIVSGMLTAGALQFRRELQFSPKF